MFEGTYGCPKCRTHLNPGGAVILLARRGDSVGLIVFSPEPGIYRLDHSKSITIHQGEEWIFQCPVCRSDLVSEADPTLSQIDLYDERGRTRKVHFSRVAGEYATFVVDEEGVKGFGEHHLKYADLVKLKFF